jgi:hypothetical protein
MATSPASYVDGPPLSRTKTGCSALKLLFMAMLGFIQKLIVRTPPKTSPKFHIAPCQKAQLHFRAPEKNKAMEKKAA